MPNPRYIVNEIRDPQYKNLSDCWNQTNYLEDLLQTAADCLEVMVNREDALLAIDL